MRLQVTFILFIKKLFNKLRVKVRNLSNPYLAPFRLKKLKKLGIDTNFTIISNNCWGGLVYQHYGLPYKTPTVGLFFFADDYIKFIYNIKEYFNTPLEFISLNESKYCIVLKEYGGECVSCPIARCGDIEIIFMHYRSPEEAKEKWMRRVKRINWNNVIYKFSEMNGCTKGDLLAFDSFPVEKKVVFTHKDYGLKSQVVYTEYAKAGFIPNDTDNFRGYLDIKRLISGHLNN